MGGCGHPWIIAPVSAGRACGFVNPRLGVASPTSGAPRDAPQVLRLVGEAADGGSIRRKPCQSPVVRTREGD
ncbi:hypothetical protein GCM10007067_28870 [Lysobacter bugurensis]|uniref:Uncharacterized protein n=1 Tax=Cognatilysobacter bugurensis TaxID=543356 RepID=A0A918WBS2_9GAMM|nr:hypothetical protein GCM10007067_28870 [Lysobacter bugurensis]